jgi:hypothetical protein
MSSRRRHTPRSTTGWGGAILYGGNFAVRREALDRIGGFDRRIEFHGEDTNLGRRLTPVGRVALCQDCWVWTSARRYSAMGKAACSIVQLLVETCGTGREPILD